MNQVCSVILNSGQYPANIRDIIKNSQYTIAADGAWDYCAQQAIAVDMVIGDMDSIKNNHLAEKHRIYLWDQNKTDADKAINHALGLGYSKINLVGICGNRLDHTIYHLQLMQRYMNQCDITGYSQTERCWIIAGLQSIDGTPGQRISLIRLDDKLQKLKTSGLKWPVTTLERHSVSNRFTSNQVTVECLTQGSHVLVMVAINENESD